MNRSWVLASNNQGKLAELQLLLTGKNLITQSTLGIAAAVENGLSFIENAIIKARHASLYSGLPAIADDSGLCVPMLGNQPGIHSAYLAGKHGDDAANNAELLRLLADKRAAGNPEAFFVCVLAFVRETNDPLPVLAQGIWWGEILPFPQGSNGFGYDSLFFLPKLGKSAAELSKEEKNAQSHRRQALDTLLSQLRQFGLL